MANWYFKEAGPGDRARESQVEKFFTSDAVANRANAIVREGIQNSLDAAPDGKAVHVRIALGEWPAQKTDSALPAYMSGFMDHFAKVSDKFPEPPMEGDAFRYLTFEDFGTSGLCGDPAQWWLDEHGESNPFFNFFRAEGISDKTEGARGRHGVGRLVFMFASRIRTIYGLTRRDDGDVYVMGTTVLHTHRVNDKPYLPDGWFGVQSPEDARLTLPVANDDAFVAGFRDDFGITRDGQSGLSIVVPWLTPDVTADEVIRAVVSGYFYPVLRTGLTVDVVNEKGVVTSINDTTISDVVTQQGAEFAAATNPVLKIARQSLDAPTRIEIPPPEGNPKWSDQELTEELRSAIRQKLEGGELVAIRVPILMRPKTSKNAGKSLPSYFDIYIARDTGAPDGQVLFIREGIIITDARHTDNRQIRCPAARALVVIDEGPLATFLGDCENPSHTQWQYAYLKDKYNLPKQHLEYVVGAVPAILRLVSEQQKKPDATLLIDLFSVPDNEKSGPKTKAKKSKKEGTETETTDVDVEPSLRRFSLDQSGSGFVIRRGDGGAQRPPLLEFEVAYGVRRGSPFVRYNSADFRLGLGGIECEFEGCESVDFGDNWMLVKINEDEFEIRVSGFDTNRDLHIRVRIKEEEAADATAV